MATRRLIRQEPSPVAVEDMKRKERCEGGREGGGRPRDIKAAEGSFICYINVTSAEAEL